MLIYAIRRLAVALVLAFGVATVCFALVWFAPGDERSDLLLSGRGAAVQPDQSPGLVEAYGDWVASLLRGDLGTSARQGDVARWLLARLPHTLALSASGLALAVVFGVGVGVLQAARAGTVLDRLLTLGTVVAYSAPAFWVGILLGGAFVHAPVEMGMEPLFPLTGVAPPGGATSLLDYVPFLVLPALTLGIVLGAGIARYTRAAMLEVLAQDYVRSARARGLTEMRVLIRHGLRTALLPLISLLGVYLPVLLTGAVFVETVFSRTGIGSAMVEAILGQDMPVLMGGALLFGFAAVAGNLVADLLYGWADPRIGDAVRG